MELRGWKVVDAERGVLWREYQFSKGAFATTLVFRGVDGLVVVSPGQGLEAADYDVLKEFGEVRALVANNSHHHLGQESWRAHFPRAESFAAPQALPKLAKARSSVPFRALDELPLPPTARAHQMSGFNNGETLFTMDTKDGPLWYSGDVLTNIQRLPGPPVRWLFSLSGSGPGYRLFRLGVWLFVKDKRAVKEQLTALVGDKPPAIVIPGHGPAVVQGDVAEETKVQIARL